MKHTQRASRRTQLLFGAFVLTMAFALSSASPARVSLTDSSTALVLRVSSSSSSSSARSVSSRSRASLLRSTRANIRSRIVKPIRRRANSGATLRPAASSAPRVPIKAGCGDKLVTGTETCDDGNVIAGDGCSASCLIETGYDCSGQPSTCWSRCGDGTVASNERCDDANTTAGDGCNAACRIEFFNTCSGSPSICKVVTVCGDTLVQGSEQCDDGNTHPGDGCSATCTDE
jgi:cysteine-rich repeat protein